MLQLKSVVKHTKAVTPNTSGLLALHCCVLGRAVFLPLFIFFVAILIRWLWFFSFSFPIMYSHFRRWIGLMSLSFLQRVVVSVSLCIIAGWNWPILLFISEMKYHYHFTPAFLFFLFSQLYNTYQQHTSSHWYIHFPLSIIPFHSLTRVSFLVSSSFPRFVASLSLLLFLPSCIR